ncbi:MAG: GTP-binding protein [Dehalococcoidales bacterium]|nr:GTP-binding protein [Dehalococcoidales bacterium]MDD5122599.1 GTP-binding protein [Dehalococcoidales bacterium]
MSNESDNLVKKKVCMLGAFAVGKTSLVRRYVENMFSEKYQTTIGVKIDKKVLEIEGRKTVLVIWDLAGKDDIVDLRTSYLRGLLVIFWLLIKRVPILCRLLKTSSGRHKKPWAIFPSLL